MRFYLGVHEPAWLSRSTVPLFVSDRRLKRRVSLPVASCDWALDSGGFTEISMHGAWITPPRAYVERVQRYQQEIGRMEFAAIQDWMCEPFMLKRTGLTIQAHQSRTIDSLERLRNLAPEVPWMPVLQGWERDDYLKHLDAYTDRGFDLSAEPVVGVGSVCRRQATTGAASIVRELSNHGLRLHLFGYKRKGLPMVCDKVKSSDSMAWSLDARKRGQPMPGCTHKACNNCFRYAMQWREETVAKIKPPQQQELFQF